MNNTQKNEMHWDGEDHAYECDEWYDDNRCPDCGSTFDDVGFCPFCDYDDGEE